MKRKLNLETDHQYIAESLPVGRGKARNPTKGTGSAPPAPHPEPAQPGAGDLAAPLRCPRAGLHLWARPWWLFPVPLRRFGEAVPGAGLFLVAQLSCTSAGHHTGSVPPCGMEL